MALTIFQQGVTAYAIVRNDMAGRYVCEAAEKLKKAFLRLGVEMPIKTDLYQKEGDIPADTPEILVGGTNRAESGGTLCPTSMGEHVIRVIGNRVVIKGGNDAGTVEAVDRFLSLFLAAGTEALSLPEDYAYTGHTTYRFDPESMDDFDPRSYLIRRIADSYVFVAGHPYAIVCGVPMPLDAADCRVVARAESGALYLPAVFCRERLGLDVRHDSRAAMIAELLGKACFFDEESGLCVIGDAERPYDVETERTMMEDTAELIHGLPYGVAELTLGDEATAFGVPSMRQIGTLFPTLTLTARFDLRQIVVRLFRADALLATHTVAPLAAGESVTITPTLCLEKDGEYRAELSLVSGGESYRYDRYVTALDPSRFAEGGETALAYCEDGVLRYVCDAWGNRLCDFSTVGYEHGASLPTPDAIPTLIRLSPCGGDDGAAIQEAIDYASTCPVGEDGYRGAVELMPGRYDCISSFNIHTSGIVLRGVGASPADTVLVGEMGQRFASIGGMRHLPPRRRPPTPEEIAARAARGDRPPERRMAPPPDRVVGERMAVTGSYLPAGSYRLPVADASAFAVGDDVVLIKTVTYPFIRYMGMSELFRNGMHQTWLAEGAEIFTERVIVAIEGNTLILDAPITDSFDADYLGYPLARVAKYTFEERTDHTGFENFTLERGSLVLDRTVDSYVKGVQILGNTGNSFVIGALAKRITCRDMVVDHEKLTVRAAPADYMITGQYLLLENCIAPLDGGSWAFVLQARGAGLTVVHNCVGAVCPHARWSVGLLVDSCEIAHALPNRHGISFINRHIMGSGHGWTVGWSVAWNVNTPYFKNEAAPGTANYCIGCVGEIVPATYRSGLYFSHGTPVVPASLYEEQVRQLKRI